MKSRSPRVVSIPSTPVRGVSGYRMARIVNRIKSPAMAAKKIAVGAVQAIQSSMDGPLCAEIDAL